MNVGPSSDPDQQRPRPFSPSPLQVAIRLPGLVAEVALGEWQGRGVRREKAARRNHLRWMMDSQMDRFLAGGLLSPRTCQGLPA